MAFEIGRRNGMKLPADSPAAAA
ncbi:MAG: hypothetical protein ACKOTB_18775 [Planctomycetia bacterium]